MVNRTWHTVAADNALWKALALSNGWRLPDDVSTATRDIVAKLNRAKAMPGTGSGAWKAWFISALVERVLDGKTERELVAAEDDHHQQTKKKKKKRVNRGFEDTNDAGGEEAEAADDDDEEEEDEEEEDATSYSNNSKVQMASRQVVVSRPIGLDDEPAAEELQGGTVWGILNFLLTEDMPNSDKAIAAFLTTHTLFTESGHVLDLAINFFEGSAHAQASDTFQRLWNKYKGQFTQARVLQMLEKWLAKYPGAFVRRSPFASPANKAAASPAPAAMRKTLDAFLERATAKAASQFEQALARLRDRLGALTATAAAAQCEEPDEGLDDDNSTPEDFEGSDDELLKEYQALDLLKIKTEVLARQLTLIDYELLQGLTHEELLEQRWKRQAKFCPNVRRFVNHFNYISAVVTTSIVLQITDKARAKFIKKWVEVADKCLQLNNISCALDIVSGIGSSPIFRLRKTWSRVSKSLVKRLEGLQAELTRSHSYKRLRDRLFTATPPCVPYLGMYLVDLAFISDGNPHLVQVDWPDHEAGVPCWPYHYMTANAINHGHPYPFTKDEELCRKLLSLKHLSAERRYQLSLLREPREPGRSAPTPSFESC
ncbi:RasGEF domain containing protein [Acanthamoeba castellanii str. Neff]|uniref:RasGEF domain containing protein n=1 Tax=Acanthamoeba castellanii (strain ATCC 30010 / Neff) TaxID=1257118 RepID=L8GSI8_ACACF|nr:RasGEF domain containing protein [Acanthamoeba castellanii str. Neff]ELR15076.1 RasGEF domain containing protein [Acanthamoeba castellanii str. Neff]